MRYIVVQNGSIFEVKREDGAGSPLATFSNRLAADKFAEEQEKRDEIARKLVS